MREIAVGKSERVSVGYFNIIESDEVAGVVTNSFHGKIEDLTDALFLPVILENFESPIILVNRDDYQAFGLWVQGFIAGE